MFSVFLSRVVTSHRAVCAVQVLKIRRPNYSDFSVKTMVIPYELVLEFLVEKIKSQFYVEICKLFNKRNEMTNNNHFVLFYFFIYQI